MCSVFMVRVCVVTFCALFVLYVMPSLGVKVQKKNSGAEIKKASGPCVETGKKTRQCAEGK